MKEVKEVKIPISTIMKTFLSSSEMKQESQDVGSTPAEEQILNLVAGNVEKVMKDSLKEVSVTVYWPVKAGTQYSSLVLVYYVVDFDAVRNFVPEM